MRRTLPLLTLGLLAGCPDRNVSEVDPTQDKVEVKDIPVQLNRELDLLFVIDDSGSMAEEQASLAANFPAFTNVLQTIEGGLPNIHLGVVSSDVGAGTGITGCVGAGDNGRLQTDAAINGFYIEDIAADGTGTCQDVDGNLTRDCNYTGTLASAFTAAASLGITGCGFEQHFESMRRALNGSNSENQGFLRDGAFLGIIFLQDEDDCSTMDADMFDISQTDPDDPLGPLSSFRCYEFGVDCEVGNSDPRAPGPRETCAPRDPSPYMYGVDEYVEFVKDLKNGDEELIIVGAITGPAEPVIVGTDRRNPQNPALVPSCSNPSGQSCTVDADCGGQICVSNECVSVADPPVRLHYFLSQFSQQTSTTICNDDLSDGLELIAELLKEAIGNPCILSTLKEPIECSVSDVQNPGEDDEVETLLPECNADEPTPLDTTDTAASSNVPCWHLEIDTDRCGTNPTQLTLVVERNDQSVPTGTHVQAECVTCIDENQNGTCDDAE